MSDFVSLASVLQKKKAPSFDAATTLRQKAWSAGFDPSYWYAVEFADAVPRGKVVEVRFQGTSVALFRGEDGTLAATENRCAHRHVKLSDGTVDGCELVCRYHGWKYDCEGRVTGALRHHDGTPLPKTRIRTYPVAEKYGLVFIFFGDPALASSRSLPHIDVLEGDDPWVVVPIEYSMNCHPTAYINNVMDSTHVAALHTTFQTRSLIYGKVTKCDVDGDTVVVAHEIALDPGGLLRHLVPPLETPEQVAYYEYPYLHVHVGGVSELWNFMLPVDEKSMKIFLLSCAKSPRIPLIGLEVPKRLLRAFAAVGKELLVRPLFDEDVWSTEAEQAGYDAHFDERELEPHPSIRPSYELTVRKWQDHLNATTRRVQERLAASGPSSK